MAWTDVTKSAIEFIEHVLNDASIWFWLAVAVIILLILDRQGFILLQQMVHEPKTALLGVLVLLACLWLNALEVHRPLTRAALTLKKGFEGKFDWWKRNRRASKVTSKADAILRDLLATQCLERRWLLWFIFECERKGQLLPYGTVMYDDEFKGARSLFTLGLLHRTGDNDSALVFFHKKLAQSFDSILERSEMLRQIVENERAEIRKEGRYALKQDLPSYGTESFFRRLRAADETGAT